MARSRQLLERHFAPATTRQLDALIEGLALHRALGEAEPYTRELTGEAVRRLTVM